MPVDGYWLSRSALGNFSKRAYFPAFVSLFVLWKGQGIWNQRAEITVAVPRAPAPQSHGKEQTYIDQPGGALGFH